MSDELTTDLTANSTTVTCSRCGDGNPPRALVCNSCGARLLQPTSNGVPSGEAPSASNGTAEHGEAEKLTATPNADDAGSLNGAGPRQVESTEDSGEAEAEEDHEDHHANIAREIDSRRAHHLLERAFALADKHETEAALLSCRQALALTPNVPVGVALLGYLMSRRGDAAGAGSAYQKVTELAPGQGLETLSLGELRTAFEEEAPPADEDSRAASAVLDGAALEGGTPTPAMSPSNRQSAAATPAPAARSTVAASPDTNVAPSVAENSPALPLVQPNPLTIPTPTPTAAPNRLSVIYIAAGILLLAGFLFVWRGRNVPPAAPLAPTVVTQATAVTAPDTSPAANSTPGAPAGVAAVTQTPLPTVPAPGAIPAVPGSQVPVGAPAAPAAQPGVGAGVPPAPRAPVATTPPPATSGGASSPPRPAPTGFTPLPPPPVAARPTQPPATAPVATRRAPVFFTDDGRPQATKPPQSNFSAPGSAPLNSVPEPPVRP